MKKKDYFVYKKICELVNSSRIVEATNNWLIVEIDTKENNHLVEDLGRKFFTKRINQRRVKKKLGMVIFWKIYSLRLKFSIFK